MLRNENNKQRNSLEAFMSSRPRYVNDENAVRLRPMNNPDAEDIHDNS